MRKIKSGKIIAPGSASQSRLKKIRLRHSRLPKVSCTTPPLSINISKDIREILGLFFNIIKVSTVNVLIAKYLVRILIAVEVFYIP